MSLFSVLQTLNIPCVYSHFRNDSTVTPPYIAYVGSGQDTFKADNTIYHKNNTYRIEYYFTEKDEAKEELIESTLLANGYIYDKSDDSYIDSEEVFVIYYFV